MNLSERLHQYFKSRCFASEDSAAGHFRKSYHRRKRIYFDEVENANVWSFYLVDRDLHHTFEEFLSERGLGAPYAVWSRPGRESVGDDIRRATFPIAETATKYGQPVPRAGDSLIYTVETLHLGDTSAVLGFLGFLVKQDGRRSLSPSVASVWLRVFVRYTGAGDERRRETIPGSLREVLRGALV
jgi:hypothetical protein